MKTRTIMGLAVFAMAAGYGILFLAKPRLQVVWKLRSEFPLISMADRLAYEANQATTATAALAPSVAERLAEAERRDPQEWERGYALELLHSRTIGDFVLANGFGEERMSGFPYPGDVEYLERPTPAPISVTRESDASVYESTPGGQAEIANQFASADSARSESALLGMHETGSRNFANSGRNGFVIDKHRVAGFQSHAFSKVPKVPASDGKPAAWRIVRLELISLLKHKVPVAYISKHLPQMDELRNAPTRPLDEFERQSLDRLKSDEDVVTDETPDRIRMVGSLRAGKNCLDCHSVRRGELLGAFTYDLVPSRPIRKKPQQEPDIN